ncbi:hypothetical protein [Candidatus Chloroploca sp. Khr17]|uniref:peptidase MA family metallohydrolase n=1 Tax=Candidatus Chloroploca sp. Khr17 TaxID=2496869 RepID=UPI00101C51C6|nr:hypothetical protein [Candidatus Chloroploca sp. Khr17]
MSLKVRAGLLSLVVLLSMLLMATPTQAQQSLDWRELQTDYFRILYHADGEEEARRYEAWVDVIYDDLATAFNYRTTPPLTLRLYPGSTDYFAVNPSARNVPGVIAHADFRLRELVVIVERTAAQSEEGVKNNVRHELTHLIAADLSNNQLNTGFHEGIAQYMERPADELEQRIRALRQTYERGLLMPWSAFDDRERIYGQPEIGYPQSLSVVAFLIEQYGFTRMREFLIANGRSSSYREALAQTYQRSAAELELAWRDWLPGYLEGGYQRNALVVYDLSFVRTLVNQGSYAAAEQELRTTVEWLKNHADTQPAAVLAEAEALLARSAQGLRAEQLAESARQALQQGDYERAIRLVADAQHLYAELNDARQAEVLAIYAERATRGLQATSVLAQAIELTRSFNYPQAHRQADQAAAEFAALGDTLRRSNAERLRDSLATQQRLVGFGLLILGSFGVVLSLLGWAFRRPAEIW